MKFGVREVTDIVFRAKYADQQVGSTTYPKDYPVLFIDSAKMSSLENTVATVYAQGGRGNPRLLAWDGDRTATFKFEDSLITNDGLAVLTGSNVISSSAQRVRQQISFRAAATGNQNFNGAALGLPTGATLVTSITPTLITLDNSGDINGVTTTGVSISAANGITVAVTTGLDYIIDFYASGQGSQLQVEAGKFAGYYYIEANSLFRDSNGVDHPSQITIPKGKIKSNFTLTMSPTGDPSTFSFEVDALPDTTYGVTDKKVLYTLDIGGLGTAFNDIV